MLSFQMYKLVAFLLAVLFQAESLITSSLPARMRPEWNRVAVVRHSMSQTENDSCTSREILSPITTSLVPLVIGSSFFFLFGSSAVADDTSATPQPSYSIERCSTSSKSPCVSTSNVRQIDLYSPPWTFPSTYSADEIMLRLKLAIVADPACEIVHQEGNQHLVVQAKRLNDLFGTLDQLEFVVNVPDQVVTFRSTAPAESTLNDFGLQRRRLDEIRKRAGVFGVMGEGMKTADSATSAERGNGPLGQLKAFYGLQSGGGFEDVLTE